MMPLAKLVAHFALASSIVLAGFEVCADTTDTNDANTSATSDPVQHDTKQSLRTADTAVIRDNEERMINLARLQRAHPMFGIHDLPHERLVPQVHDMYGPAGAPHPAVAPHTDEAKVDEYLQHAASMFFQRKEMSPADTYLAEREISEAEIMTDIEALFQLGYKPSARKRDPIINDMFSETMHKWWQNDVRPILIREMAKKNKWPGRISSKYDEFHGKRNNIVRSHFDKWLEDGIPLETIEDRIIAAISEPVKKAVVTNLMEEYMRLYFDVQSKMNYWLKEGKTPVEADYEILILPGSKKDADLRMSRYRKIYTKLWCEKYPMEVLQMSKQAKVPPEDVRTMLGLGRLESPELFRHENYKHYRNYLEFWFVDHPMEYWQKGMLKGFSPQDARNELGLGQLKGLELSQHPNFPDYIKFFEVWHDSRMRRNLEEWFELGIPPDEVFARLAFRDHEDVEFIPDMSDAYYQMYLSEWNNLRAPPT